MTFENLELHPLILKAIRDAGYNTPTAIQAEAIPQILAGKDLRASAQTGSGKTAAFVLPALHKLTGAEKPPYNGPKVLVLAPTRELAMQIGEQVEKYSKHMKHIKSVCIAGGVPYPVQLRKMRTPYEILIATPGRLIDYLERGKISLANVELCIIDEADRMLDMGFFDPVKEIVSETPDSRQTILFSATFPKNVVKLSNELLKNPVEILLKGSGPRHENIEQTMHFTDDVSHKMKLLDHILQNEDVKNTIIFTSTKRHADELAYSLQEKNYSAAALHGDMTQNKRTKTISQLKNGKLRVLIATDVAARGIDVQSISHVINFDLPRNVEDYVHRIGRTGRAGAQGSAFSFVGSRDAFLVKKIESFTGHDIAIKEIPGLEPKKRGSSAAPRQKKNASYPRSSKKTTPFFHRRSRGQVKKK